MDYNKIVVSNLSLGILTSGVYLFLMPVTFDTVLTAVSIFIFILGGYTVYKVQGIRFLEKNGFEIGELWVIEIVSWFFMEHHLLTQSSEFSVFTVLFAGVGFIANVSLVVLIWEVGYKKYIKG